MDKVLLEQQFFGMMYNRTLTMFKYENLPINVLEMEKLLQKNGYVVIVEEENQLYATDCGFTGQDVYNRPTHAIITNPHLKSRTLEIGVECALIKNDLMELGLQKLFEKYATLSVETDVSLLLANYNSRIQTFISASDSNTIESAEKYLEKVVNGELGVIGEQRLLESLKVFDKRNNTTNISNLIELQQYLKASLFNEIGLNANYNMKRERLISAEVAMNSDMLYPLVDNMLDCRIEGIEKVNEIFDLNASVDLTSIWKIKQIELEQSIESEETPGTTESDEPTESEETIESEETTESDETDESEKEKSEENEL